MNLLLILAILCGLLCLYKWFQKPVFSFTGKTILITGVSEGNIGHYLARCCAPTAQKIILAHFGSSNVAAVAADCKALGCPDVVVCEADLTKEKDLNQLMGKFQKLDLLIMMHVASKYCDCLEISVQDLRNLLEINLLSCVRLTQLCFPFLSQSNGRIIVASSLAGITPLPNRNAYSVSKAALDMWISCLAMEHPSLDIQVVRLGMTNTPPVQAEYAQNTMSSFGALNPDSVAQQILAAKSLFPYFPITGYFVHALWVLCPSVLRRHLTRFLPKTKRGTV